MFELTNCSYTALRAYTARLNFSYSLLLFTSSCIRFVVLTSLPLFSQNTSIIKLRFPISVLAYLSPQQCTRPSLTTNKQLTRSFSVLYCARATTQFSLLSHLSPKCNRLILFNMFVSDKCDSSKFEISFIYRV